MRRRPRLQCVRVQTENINKYRMVLQDEDFIY
jgi:hypothetical protein